MSSKIVIDNVTGSITADGQPITGGGGAATLDELTDVTLTSPASDQVLKYNGTAWVNGTVSAASDLDGLTDVTLTSPTAGQVLKYNGTAWINGTDSTGSSSTEGISVVASALTGTVNIDTATSQVHYYTVNATANWTPNIRSTSSASLDSVMSIGQSMTVTIMSALGASGFYASALQIDGVSVTPKWANGMSPSFGNEYSIDIYSYTIVKTASATFTVFASVSPFA
jgi:hypothetical protein